MRWRPKSFALVSALALALLIALAYANHAFDADRFSPALACVEAALFAVFVYALVPPVIRLFLAGQRKLGNAALPLVAALAAREKQAVYTIWGVYTLGLAIALPAMLADMRGGALEREPQLLLSVNLGMTLAELRQRSSLALEDGSEPPTSQFTANTTFDFEIAGTGTRFDGCRYYWVEAQRGSQVSSVRVGISAHGIDRRQLELSEARAQQRLRRDGWRQGRWRAAQAESALRGSHWLKGETILQLAHDRVDAEQPGEDARAGAFMLYVHLWPRAAPLFRDLQFE